MIERKYKITAIEKCKEFDAKRIKREFRYLSKHFKSVVYITCCKKLKSKIKNLLGESLEVYCFSELKKNRLRKRVI
jgi:hypothetical protein